MKAILKYPGSKWSMAEWIISQFPDGYEKMTYLEPFFGSGAIFFNKKRSVIETINDLDNDVVNLFKVIRDNPEELARLIEFTPWSREEYRESYERTGISNEDARRFLVRSWQAIGFKSSDITGWRNNVKSLNGNVTDWSTELPERIKYVSDRLKHTKGFTVQIENQSALKLIERHNRTNVLIYADPPYVLQTRSGRIYKHEMNDTDQIELLKALINHSGPVIISGYESDLYNSYLKGWQKQTLDCTAEGGVSRQEVIWINYETSAVQIGLSV